jgi:replicative DNA helicase Mcm
MNANRCREVLAELIDDETRHEVAEMAAPDRALEVDWQDLAARDAGEKAHPHAGGGSDEYAAADVRGVASDVLARPDPMLDRLDEAVRALDVPGGGSLAETCVHVTNLPDDRSFAVGAFSPSSHRDHLIEVEGQITKRTELQPSLRVGCFECLRCGNERRLDQPPFGKIQKPGYCDGCEQNGAWKLREGRSEWKDHQKFRLQQPPEKAVGETKNIDVHAFGDLAGLDIVEGGQRVTVTAHLVEVYTGKVHFDKRLIANAIVPNHSVFDAEDLDEYDDTITRLREADDTFAQLLESMAPGYQGNDRIQEALLVQMFTGGLWIGPDGARYRGDSHVNLCGDPGTGKSVLLDAIRQRVPIGAMATGEGSSGVGLTASVTKDDFADGESWSIEAGTLVRASGGMAAIDELDKADPDDLGKLHTALERQEVLVDKAGKKAILPAETVVLAAQNPTGGHYDPNTEFAEQVDIKSPLLSRFDMIFVLREQVDEEKVRRLARAMIRSRNEAAKYERDELDAEDVDAVDVPVSIDQFRAYVAAAKRITPVIRDEAVEKAIEDWYVSLKTDLPNRYRGDDAPPLPVTARKVDAMCRLAAASARIRFSETIEMQDIERVRPYIKRSLADIGIEPGDNEAFDPVASDIDPEEIGV